MFDLPKGTPVDDEIDVADGVIQPLRGVMYQQKKLKQLEHN